MKSCGRARGGFEEPGGDGDSTRRSTESTNLDPLGLSETEPPTKEHMSAEANPILPHTYVADVQLGHLVNPPTTGFVAYPDSVVCWWILIP